MRKQSIFISVLLLITLLSVPILAATEVRRVENPQQEPSAIEGFIDWLGKNLVLIFVALLIIGLVILVIWLLLKYLKRKRLEKDLALKDFESVLANCKSQADSTRIRKRTGVIWGIVIIAYVLILLNQLLSNAPLIVTWFNALLYLPFVIIGGLLISQLGLLTASDPVYTYGGKMGHNPKWQGWYVGDYVGEDGYHNIAYWNGRKWLLFKKYYVVKCNMNRVIPYYERQKNVKSGKLEIVKREITMEDGLVIKYKGNITIKGLALDRLPDGYFQYPVLYDSKSGNVVDNRFIHADRLKHTYLNQMIIDTTSDYAQAMREAILVNPTVRGYQKMKTETIDRPSSEEDRRYNQ
jgi:hypothetical protein